MANFANDVGQTSEQKLGIQDRFGRRIDYLRVSVTDRCDLRCGYCIPKGQRAFCERKEVLTAQEFARLVGLFVSRGVARIRLTGGEPLTRPDLVEIVRLVRGLSGVEDISLSTNGTQLASQAGALRLAGVSRLNISLDSLQTGKFAQITGRDCLHDVLTGIESAAAAGFSPIKINMVVQPGENDDEIDEMVDFCRKRGLVLRFIERMPIGTAAEIDRSSLQPIRLRLLATHTLIDAVVPGGGPARYLKDSQGEFTVGFITPISQHFCATCNRLRLGSDGSLYTCLDAKDSVPLGHHMRNGASNDELQEMISKAIWSRPEKHTFESTRDRSGRLMAVTGG